MVYREIKANERLRFLMKILFFLQCDQEEELRLESGHTYPYSLFDHASNALQFRLEKVGNCPWSNEVKLNEEGVTTCLFEHEGYTSKLIVEVILIGGLQYEVGLFIFSFGWFFYKTKP